MTIELTPNGVACNMDCPYCYQKPMRDAGNISHGYDMAKMKEGLLKEGGAFALFGGEPLLLPLDDLEELFAFGLERYGSNGLQTNGSLITPEHVALFKRYRAYVGISVDGPGDLNDNRWMGSFEKTRIATAASMRAIEMLCQAGIAPSLIITLHRANALGEHLTRLLQWFRDLEQIGVRYIRLHLLEVENEHIRNTLALTIDENIDALLRLYDFQKATSLQFDLFREMAQLLLGNDYNSTCIWNACDPYTTAAVRGVDGQGVSSNCGRTNKDGVNWQKADKPGFERQIALYSTPQSDLGCQGCRFFFACKGQCPGTAEHGDWRNRSEHCEIWKALFEQIEGDLRGLGFEPLSMSTKRLELEARMLEAWANGQNISIQNALRNSAAPCPDREHGDHWDAPDGYHHSDGAFDIHGDSGKTIMHGDSNARLDATYMGQPGRTSNLGTTTSTYPVRLVPS